MILTTARQGAGNLSRMKTRWSSSLTRLAVAGALLLPTGSSLAQELTDSLPVTRVVLYTNGVAYFEHSGTVSGDQELALQVDSANMDDLLQSLVLREIGRASRREGAELRESGGAPQRRTAERG